MYFNIITQPTVEPLTVDELKAHLRVVGTTEDDYITAIGRAARSHVEWRTGRTLMQTTYEALADSFPCDSRSPLVLPNAAPLQSVTFIKYTSSDGTVTTVDPSQYVVNIDAMPGLIRPAYGLPWPQIIAYPTGAIRIRYVAGLSVSPITYPEDGLLSAIKLLAGALYEYREAEIVPDKPGIQAISMKYGIEPLLAQYRVAFVF